MKCRTYAGKPSSDPKRLQLGILGDVPYSAAFRERIECARGRHIARMRQNISMRQFIHLLIERALDEEERTNSGSEVAHEQC